jgi:PAS domain S-box-containing protein
VRSPIGNEERFRTIFEDAVIGLYRTTPDGHILMANPAMIKMLGFSSFEELAAINLEQWPGYTESSRVEFKDLMDKHGKVIGREAVWLRSDGTKLFAYESAVAIRDRQGNILYYEGSVEDITERKEAEDKLLMYQMQLRSLASELSLAEERLRRRIASDVHDNIGQNLAISKIKLDSLRQLAPTDELGRALEEISLLIAEAIKSSRSLTFELSPPVLYELGFEPAMEWLVKDVRERHGVSADFQSDGKEKPLEHDIRVLLFQSVRELLVNVAKHAKAANVTVRSARKGDKVNISVEDDGKGFDASNISSRGSSMGGYGLFSIRERLGHVGGSLEIDSKIRKGTKITMVVKVSRRD